MNTLIKSVTLIPMDGRAPIEDADIHIEGGAIRFAGASGDAPAFSPERVIEGKGRIAMPGLVNAHTHVAMTLLRGVGSDLPLQRWLNEAIFPIEDRMTAQDVYWGSMLGIMEMLRFGVTSFLDMYMFEEEVAQAVEKTGIRAALTRCVVGSGNDDLYRLEESAALFRDWNGACEGRLRVMEGPHSEYATSPDMLKKVIAQADRLGCGVHIHLSETELEVQQCIERHGVTPVRYLADMGLFDRHAVAAHCTHMTEQDADILQQKGVFIAHNPISNLKLGSGIMPIYEGLLPNIALGTDGTASNNTLSVLEELRFAAILHKGAAMDPALVGVDQALCMATVNGARALGFGDVGTLSPGMRADIILIDTSGAHATPMNDPLSHIAYSAQGKDVSLTMVDGHVLYEKGQFSTFDSQEVIARAKSCAKELTGDQ